MSRGPRRLGETLRDFAGEFEPQTPLARVQAAWERAAGPEFARRCRPVAERDGVITVDCDASVWAAELDLSQAEIVARLRREEGLSELRSLRARTGGGE